MAAADGDVDLVTITKGAPTGFESAEVILPYMGNPYTFETRGYADVGAPVIAYATQEANVRDDATVVLQPVSVLGAAQLVPRLPLNYVVPGSVVDLMLVVVANGSDALQVPLSDFAATYEVDGDATVIATSNRGIRLAIGEQCAAPFTVNGAVEGLVEDGGSYVAGSVGINGDDGYEVVCPSPTDSGLIYDSESPTVEITSFDAGTGVVAGTAEDNAGIAKVQLFDGPALVASTDVDEATAPVALIEFVDNSTLFTTTLVVDPVAGLTAIAFDTSGNQSVDYSLSGEEFRHCPLNTDWYVSSISGDNAAATGELGTPFATIQAAVSAASADDVLCVAPGTYEVDNSGRGTGGAFVAVARITKPLTLIGPNAGRPAHGDRGPEARIIASSTEGDWLLGFSVEVSDVTVDGFYISTNTPKADDDTHYTVWGFYVSSGAQNNVTISNNHVVDANRPIWVNRGTVADDATGFVVEGNLVEGPEQISDQAIVMHGATGVVLNNVVRDTRVGVQAQVYGQGGPGLVSGNDIEAFQIGLWLNSVWNAASDWEFSDNQVMGTASPLGWPLYGEDPAYWSGLRVEGFDNGRVAFTNNVVRAGAADPGDGNAYLLRQRSHRDGTVIDIGTATELGAFFTSNVFPEIPGGVTLAHFSVDADLLQLVAPTP